MSTIRILLLLLAFLFVRCSNSGIDEPERNQTASTDILNGWKIFKSNYHFSIHPSDLFFLDSRTGFVAGYNGMIYKTVNGGGSWQKLNTGTTLHCTSVFFLNESIGYASTVTMSNCIDNDCDKGSALLKTIDGGQIWTKTFFKDYGGIYSLHFFDELRGVAIIHIPEVPNAQSTFMAKTSDGGLHWKFIDLDISPGSENFFCVDNIVFVAGVKQKIYKTKNYGTTWDTLSTPISSWNSVRNFYFLDERVGYMDGVTDIYKTTDGGKTWIKVHFPFSTLGVFHFFDESEGFNIEFVSVYEGGEVPTFKGCIGYQTSDGGNSWSKTDLTDSLRLGITYFPQKDLGFSINFSEFYTIKKK